MRLFVAVVPPPEVRREAIREARSLPWKGQVRWLPPDNVHLTLKFLGQTPETGLSALQETLSALCGGHGALDLTLQGAGGFPSSKRARVLWVGVERGAEPLRALATEVEDELTDLGFARENRPFHPHATVGRARDGYARLETSRREVGPLCFEAESVELLESRRSREGVVYSTIATYPLESGGSTAT